MSPVFRRRIRPAGSDGFAVRLPGPERELVTSLPDQLDALLAALPDDPPDPGAVPDSLARLLPPAYLHDEDAEAAFARARRGELVAERRGDLATLKRVVDTGIASAVELEACCGALNDLRLVLGTSLEVTEDQGDLDESDPAYPQWVCYRYLSALQSEIVEALSGVLPPPRPGADDQAPEDPWGDPLGGLRWDGTPLPGT